MGTTGQTRIPCSKCRAVLPWSQMLRPASRWTRLCNKCRTEPKSTQMLNPKTKQTRCCWAAVHRQKTLSSAAFQPLAAAAWGDWLRVQLRNCQGDACQNSAPGKLSGCASCSKDVPYQWCGSPGSSCCLQRFYSQRVARSFRTEIDN